MAFLQTQFFSSALSLCCSVNVLMPVAKTRAQDREVPVLYLLHGYSDDHSIWMRHTSIERYAAALAPEFAVVMPAIDHSFYTNMKNGNRYWTYINEELPQLLSSLFPLSAKREDTYVAGLSMGGYGALKLALNNPDRFRACASFSGACEMGTRLSGIGDSNMNREIINIFGTPEEFNGSVNDLSFQAEIVAKKAIQPDFYLACGTKDFLYQNNLSFLKHMQDLKLPVKWEATPDREHTWDYWDEQIQITLKWFNELRISSKA